jgi:HlyD family secretion protein
MTMKRPKRLWWLILPALVMVLLFWRLLRPRVVVEVAPVQRGAITVTVDEDGKMRVRDRFVVNATLTGELERISLRAGDVVQAGQPIATLVSLAPGLLDVRARGEAEARIGAAAASQQRAQAAAERAETALRFARSDAERMRTLAEEGAATLRDRERAETELQAAEKDLRSAQFASHAAAHELEMARAARLTRQRGGERFALRAPVSGRVLRVVRESEGFVNGGDPLLEIGNPSSLEAVVDVLSTDAVEIIPGAEATLVHWGGKAPLKARVSRVEPSAVTKVSALGVEEQRVNVILDITSPLAEWQKLGDGYRVEAQIVVFHGSDVLKAPTSAMFRSGQDWAVFVLDGHRARRRKITVGPSNGVEFVAEGGLKQGERVLVHPGDAIHEGTRVRFR